MHPCLCVRVRLCVCMYLHVCASVLCVHVCVCVCVCVCVLTELGADVLIRVFLPQLVVLVSVAHEREDHLLAQGLGPQDHAGLEETTRSCGIRGDNKIKQDWR